jgi:N-acetylneuraminic acid mutarotase
MGAKYRVMLAAILLICVAGLVTAQQPEVTHNTWTSGAAMPTAAWTPAVAVLGKEIYLVGGVDSADSLIADVQIFAPATNTWTAGVALPTAISYASAAVVKNILYVMGGYDGSGYSNAVWAYSTKTKSWASKATMPVAASDAGVAVYKDIIYVIGGNGSENLRLNTVQSYDPATDTWTQEAPLLNGKSEPSAAAVGSTIVAADGYTTSGDGGDNEGYDVATNTWRALTADPTPRNGACGGAIGSLMYVAGGDTGGGPGTPALDVNESFKLSKDSWATLASMPQATMFAGSVAYDKQLYCFGGTSTFTGTVLDNVQIYQP